jgi:two-component system nitrogen regulation response regulator GlnG
VLDEIGELPLALQGKLLRALQERTVDRLGGNRPIQVDVRLIALTNRDLATEVREGRFREDLYYRLNVVPINLPPLRERPDDVEALARHFLQLAASEGLPRRQLTPDAADLLRRQPWRGNVRELRNFIYRMALLAREDIVDAAALQPMLEQAHRAQGDVVEGGASLEVAVARWLVEMRPPSGSVYDAALAAFERPLFAEVLRETAGNQLRAAQHLGINRNTLRKRLSELAIDPEEFARRG